MNVKYFTTFKMNYAEKEGITRNKSKKAAKRRKFLVLIKTLKRLVYGCSGKVIFVNSVNPLAFRFTFTIIE